MTNMPQRPGNHAGTGTPNRPTIVNRPVPEEWKRRIARELEAGEELLWVDQPDPTLALFRSLRVIGPILVVLAFMLAFVLWLSWDNIRQGQIGFIVPPGLLLLLIFVALFLLLWQRRLAQWTCYALSSRRALVFLPGLLGKLGLTNYSPEQLRQARFEGSRLFGPEAGDWIFRQIITITTKRYTVNGIRTPWRDEVFRGVKSYGFLSLRHARQIEPILRRVAQQR